MLEHLTFENLLLGAVCISIATVAVLYLTGKLFVRCGSQKNGYSLDDDNITGNICSYLAKEVKGMPNADEMNSLCEQYRQTCGNGSAASKIFNMDINFDGPQDDGSFLNDLQQSVLEAKLNTSTCEPLLRCNPSKMVNCPPFLSCNKGSCS